MLVRSMLKTEFRRIDPAIARVVLVDMAPRVLGTFAAELSEAAQHRLKKLGVEARLGHGVDQIDADGVVVGGERIASKAVIWTAGVAPSPAGKWLNVETDRAGRVRIQDDLTVPGYPDIYVIGDTASLQQHGKPLPGVAQVAIQQGQYAGRRIAQSLLGQASSKPFRYFDKGNMAVIGAGFAVIQTGRVRLSGLLAWLAWAAVHLEFLTTTSLRLAVLLQWLGSFVTRQTGVRLIVNHIPLSRPNQIIELAKASAGRKEMTRFSP
jgi:NADH dehydrogenase FAD-containing subunit